MRGCRCWIRLGGIDRWRLSLMVFVTGMMGSGRFNQIRIRSLDDEGSSWDWCDARGERGSGLSALAAHVSRCWARADWDSDDWWVWAPAESCVFHRLRLPRLSSAQLQRALPLALDDVCALPPEHLHVLDLAHEPVLAEDQDEVWVDCVSVERASMRAWLSVLDGFITSLPAGGRAQRLCVLPELFSVPWLERADGEAGQRSVSVFVEQERCLWRAGRFQGAVCHRDDLAAVLSAQLGAELVPTAEAALQPVSDLGEAVTGGRLGLRVFLSGESDDIALPSGARLLGPSQHFEWSDLASVSGRARAVGVKDCTVGNLLVGDFRQKGTTAGLKPWLMVLVFGLCLGAAAMFARLWLDGQQLAQANRQLELTIAQRFEQLMPPGSRLQDARFQMEQRLQRLGGAREEAALFPMVAAMLEPLKSSRDSALRSLSLDADGLVVVLSIGDAQALERLRQALSEQGLTVRLLSVEDASGGLLARLGLAAKAEDLRAVWQMPAADAVVSSGEGG